MMGGVCGVSRVCEGNVVSMVNKKEGACRAKKDQSINIFIVIDLDIFSKKRNKLCFWRSDPLRYRIVLIQSYA